MQIRYSCGYIMFLMTFNVVVTYVYIILFGYYKLKESLNCLLFIYILIWHILFEILLRTIHQTFITRLLYIIEKDTMVTKLSHGYFCTTHILLNQ